MAKEMNPFIVAGKLKEPLFCGRQKESAWLVESLTSGKNITLIAPRRMGKTALIRHCFEKPKIKQEHYTFFINILHTSSLREFTYLLCREVYEKLFIHNDKAAILFLQTLNSLRGKLEFNPISSLLTFNLNIGDIDKPEVTLSEILQYLETVEKRCIIAINEFQQVVKYEEKNIEELLRIHIQQKQNCRFVFAGSNIRTMTEIFISPLRPFHHNGNILILKEILPEEYIPFVVKHFELHRRRINCENVEKVYNLFKGHTDYIQKTFNKAFDDTFEGEECTLDTIQAAIDNLIAYNETLFREILSNTSEKQKELLYAIAKDGEAERITSAEFIKRHSLTSASSVQSATNKLLEKDVITEENKFFSVTDKLFAMWINNIYGNKYNLPNNERRFK